MKCKDYVMFYYNGSLHYFYQHLKLLCFTIPLFPAIIKLAGETDQIRFAFLLFNQIPLAARNQFQ